MQNLLYAIGGPTNNTGNMKAQQLFQNPAYQN